eukprot:752071-Amphidinium_carterae.1
MNYVTTEIQLHTRKESATSHCGRGESINFNQFRCGVIGNSVRREYRVLGDVVNLSARLMAKANTGEVLVDEETYSAAQDASW